MKGVELKPWKERVQSTCFSSSERVWGGSERPAVRERRGGSGVAREVEGGVEMAFGGGAGGGAGVVLVTVVDGEGCARGAWV